MIAFDDLYDILGTAAPSIQSVRRLEEFNSERQKWEMINDARPAKGNRSPGNEGWAGEAIPHNTGEV